jgi:hypothetical protein
LDSTLDPEGQAEKEGERGFKLGETKEVEVEEVAVEREAGSRSLSVDDARQARAEMLTDLPGDASFLT